MFYPLAVTAWDETLSSVRLILDVWLEVQNRWNHIAPLFGAQAFHEQLPEEVRGTCVHGCVHRHLSLCVNAS